MKPDCIGVDHFASWFPVKSQECARGRSGTPQGPQRANGGVERAGKSPRLGGPEEYKRSTRSLRGGAWHRSAGMRPEHLLRIWR
jgi:hypothetical protein